MAQAACSAGKSAGVSMIKATLDKAASRKSFCSRPSSVVDTVFEELSKKWAISLALRAVKPKVIQKYLNMAKRLLNRLRHKAEFKAACKADDTGALKRMAEEVMDDFFLHLYGCAAAGQAVKELRNEPENVTPPSSAEVRAAAARLQQEAEARAAKTITAAMRRATQKKRRGRSAAAAGTNTENNAVAPAFKSLPLASVAAAASASHRRSAAPPNRTRGRALRRRAALHAVATASPAKVEKAPHYTLKQRIALAEAAEAQRKAEEKRAEEARARNRRSASRATRKQTLAISMKDLGNSVPLPKDSPPTLVKSSPKRTLPSASRSRSRSQSSSKQSGVSPARRSGSKEKKCEGGLCRRRPMSETRRRAIQAPVTGFGIRSGIRKIPLIGNPLASLGNAVVGLFRG